jgi:hypothetical protein
MGLLRRLRRSGPAGWLLKRFSLEKPERAVNKRWSDKTRTGIGLVRQSARFGVDEGTESSFAPRIPRSRAGYRRTDASSLLSPNLLEQITPSA